MKISLDLARFSWSLLGILVRSVCLAFGGGKPRLKSQKSSFEGFDPPPTPTTPDQFSFGWGLTTGSDS